MRVTIVGPNLTDQSKGYFHVHAAYCNDLKNYGRGRKFGGENEDWTIDASSKFEVGLELYGDHFSDFGYEEGSPEANSYIEQNLSDIHFFPCVKELA